MPLPTARILLASVAVILTAEALLTGGSKLARSRSAARTSESHSHMSTPSDWRSPVAMRPFGLSQTGRDVLVDLERMAAEAGPRGVEVESRLDGFKIRMPGFNAEKIAVKVDKTLLLVEGMLADGRTVHRRTVELPRSVVDASGIVAALTVDDAVVVWIPFTALENDPSRARVRHPPIRVDGIEQRMERSIEEGAAARAQQLDRLREMADMPQLPYDPLDAFAETVLGKQLLEEIGALSDLLAHRSIEVKRTDGGLVISLAGLATGVQNMTLHVEGATLELIAKSADGRDVDQRDVTLPRRVIDASGIVAAQTKPDTVVVFVPHTALALDDSPLRAGCVEIEVQRPHELESHPQADASANASDASEPMSTAADAPAGTDARGAPRERDALRNDLLQFAACAEAHGARAACDEGGAKLLIALDDVAPDGLHVEVADDGVLKVGGRTRDGKALPTRALKLPRRIVTLEGIRVDAHDDQALITLPFDVFEREPARVHGVLPVNRVEASSAA